MQGSTNISSDPSTTAPAQAEALAPTATQSSPKPQQASMHGLRMISASVMQSLCWSLSKVGDQWGGVCAVLPVLLTSMMPAALKFSSTQKPAKAMAVLQPLRHIAAVPLNISVNLQPCDTVGPLWAPRGSQFRPVTWDGVYLHAQVILVMPPNPPGMLLPL
jgi:hypothetical protein